MQMETALRAMIAAGRKPDIRGLLDGLLEQGKDPRALMKVMEDELRRLYADVLDMRTFLTEVLLPAHYVAEGRRYLQAAAGLPAEGAGELLFACGGGAYFSPYHSAVRILAGAIGHPAVELGCGLEAEGLSDVWDRHPGALGLLFYEGTCLPVPEVDSDLFSCCCGRSLLTAARPGAPLTPVKQLLSGPLPEDFALLLRFADLLR